MEETRKITKQEAEQCAAEAIHLIGSIQPHGFQITLDRNTLNIVQYSDNLFDLLKQYNATLTSPEPEIIGSSLLDWITPQDEPALHTLPEKRSTKLAFKGSDLISDEIWECIGHQSAGWICLEFIPRQDEHHDSMAVIKKMDNMVELLREAKDAQALYDTITTQFQAYTEYDRVMMYQFLPDWTGEVISEAVSSREQIKYLKLRFPADDIPTQARELYKSNKMRVFADVNATPAKLVPQLLPDGEPFDQSYSLLRNMSDMHRRYLKNMRVNATIALSIVIDNKLWGMLVFHHNEPKNPPEHIVAQLKLTCELFVDIVTSYLAPSLNIHRLSQIIHINTQIDTVFRLAKAATFSHDLFNYLLSEVHQATQYDYLGLIYDKKCYVWHDNHFFEAAEPTLQAINSLFLEDDPFSFKSHRLIKDNNALPGLEKMAGIYAMRSKFINDFCVFFGQEEVEKYVDWGGKPDTVDIVIRNDQRILEPRSSFALWRQKTSGECEYWDEKDHKVLECFFNACKDFVTARHNELLMNKLEENSYQDPLTKLANKAYLEVLVGDLRKKKSIRFISLLFIDLDNFKDVNNLMGHDVGDQVLITVAERLKRICRIEDLVSRLGGDEFVLVITHKQRPDERFLSRLTDKVIAAVSEPFVVNDHSIMVTPSVGVISEESSRFDFNETLKRADIAMFTAKAKGKNRFHFFDLADQLNFNKQAILTSDLKKYITDGQVEIHYQAQCDFQKKIKGAEALVRWKHPEYGYIDPEAFIQIAEKNNLISKLGMCIFEKVCHQMAQWKALKVSENLKTVSINISPSQLQAESFEAEVIRLVEKYQLKPSEICLEITESVFMLKHDEVINRLQFLRNKGFSIALDDFGTGYSSLNYLWKLPVDEVKIDKSFISSMNQTDGLFTMVESIIDLCKKLKLEVVAEGVENKMEFNLLKGLGCDTCQGFINSRPQPPSEFIRNMLNA